MDIATQQCGPAIVLSEVRWLRNAPVSNEFDRTWTARERSTMTQLAGLERRSGQDRREDKRPVFKKLYFKGMRASVRRTEDRQRIVALDLYKPSLFIGIMIVLCLSLLDALLTLMLIAQGARELNPVMQYYLSHGPQVFLLVKYGLTAFSVLIIVLLKESLITRYRIGTGMLLHVFAAFFGSVVIWELYLLSI
jgi:hypothetical protein